MEPAWQPITTVAHPYEAHLRLEQSTKSSRRAHLLPGSLARRPAPNTCKPKALIAQQGKSNCSASPESGASSSPGRCMVVRDVPGDGSMMHYHQFCPIAKAAEIVAERWTPLVVHELLAGSTRFNDIRRGVPLMSQTLLSQRLKELERVGVVEHRGDNPRQREWYLTPAGRALAPIVHQLGEWGLQYAQDPLEEGDLDV